MTTAPAIHGQRVDLSASSVVLIGSDQRRRHALAELLGRLSVRIKADLPYVPGVAEVAELIAEDCDAVLIDVEEDTDLALSFIEELGRVNPTLTAMAYAHRNRPELLLRCMESGARTLLQEPIALDALTTAMVRASARRTTVEQAKTGGKTFAFWSVKGGAGASTLAANFAVSLASASKQKVALVDLNFEPGDLAVLLDVKPRFSVLDAVHSAERLDWDFLSGLMTEHSSGVSLLAAPENFGLREPGNYAQAILRVMRLLENQFAYVVIDAATNRNVPESLVKMFDAIYLVAQADIPSLRHAQRLSSYLANVCERPGQVHVVLNRYEPRRAMITTEEIEKSVGLPVAWRIPNDYESVRDAGNTGVLSAFTQSTVGKAVREMAASACSKPEGATEQKAKKKGWGLFG